MNLREVPPESLEISDMNERTTPPLTDDLAKSVRKQGVVQPPIVREATDASRSAEYEVVVGQRRTLAAQKAGLDSLAVVVTNWNDAEALEASITENIETFVDGVSETDRAAAVERLMELHDESRRAVAKRLGVDEKSVRNWLEATRDEWRDTDVEPGYRRPKRQGVERSDSAQDGDIYAAAAEGASELADEVGGSTLSSIRSVTGGGEEGEEMAYQVAKGEMNQSDVRDIARSVSSGESAEDIQESSGREERASTPSSATTTASEPESGEIGVQLTLPESTSSKLESRAQADGVSEEEIVRRAVDDYLNED